MANSQIRISVNNLKESLEFYKAALAPANLYPSFNRSDGTAIGFSKRFLRYNLSPSLWLITAGASLTSDLDSDLNPLPSDTTATGEGAELTEGLLKDSEVEGLESGSGRFSDDANSQTVTRGVYIGIAVDTRPAVDGFYEASLAAGGKGVTPPGVHPRKGKLFKWYYSAVVEDPDGRSIELSCEVLPVLAGKYGWLIRSLLFVFYMAIMFLQYYKLK